jgi:uncharacterized protein (DUF2249 family)
MGELTTAIMKHHGALAARLSGFAKALADGDAGDPQGLVEFLKRELLPHAQAEESHIYPQADILVREHGRPTTTMTVDHQCIAGYVRKIEEAAAALRTADAAEQARLAEELGRAALALDAIFKLHLQKEECVYLPLFEQYVPAAEQHRILHAMHESSHAGAEASPRGIVDVRRLVPRERHPLILAAFEALKPSEDFMLVNDHDPKPLYYQFQAERPGEFVWEYLERGPEVWRVRIGKSGQRRGAQPGA